MNTENKFNKIETLPNIPNIPREYLDLNGKERDLPMVKKIMKAIDDGKNFQVSGSGGSGKTEQLITALVLAKKEYQTFNLRAWTIKNISNKEFRKKWPSMKNINSQALKYLENLERRLNRVNNEDEIKEVIKQDYAYDKTMGIKYLENWLLQEQIDLQKNNEQDKNNIPFDNSLQKLLNSESDVIVLDEFDLSINNNLDEIEIDNIKKILSLIKNFNQSQVVKIIHPQLIEVIDSNSLNDKNFIQALKDNEEEVNEIETEYFSEEIERAFLEKINIKNELAEKCLAEFQGFPGIYIRIFNDKNFQEELMTLSDEERVKKIREKAIENVRILKRVNFEKISPIIKDLILEIIQNKEPENIDEETRKMTLRTMFVKEDNGKLVVPLLIREVISEEYD
jgi:energy-coupling factor transporter ATP-binding protein EcfA2